MARYRSALGSSGTKRRYERTLTTVQTSHFLGDSIRPEGVKQTALQRPTLGVLGTICPSYTLVQDRLLGYFSDGILIPTRRYEGLRGTRLSLYILHLKAVCGKSQAWS